MTLLLPSFKSSSLRTLVCYHFQSVYMCDSQTVFITTVSDPEEFNPDQLPQEILKAIEADAFWCLTRLLDGIQDNYISAQPGIQRSVKRMAELVARIDRKSNV